MGSRSLEQGDQQATPSVAVSAGRRAGAGGPRAAAGGRRFLGIASAFFLFLVLAACYDVVAPRFLPPGALHDPAESEIMRNLIRAEQVLRADPPAAAVLLGTSMSERLEDIEGIMNLSMSGCSPATGLAVLHRAGIAPRLLLVEANNFPGPVSNDVYGNLFGAIPWGVRKALPVLGYSYRPSTVLVNGLRWRASRAAPAGARAVAPDPQIAPELFERLLNDELRDFIQPVDRARDLPNLDEVRLMIEELMARHGTRVVFFEMPVHPAIAASPRCATRRAILQAEFPSARYTWIAPPEGRFTTTDGVHLVPSSARAYRDFFVAAVARLRDEIALRQDDAYPLPTGSADGILLDRE